MNTEFERWKHFWNTKASPLHRSNTEAYYDVYGQELMILMPKFRPRSVLELGCGTGTFYDRLGFVQAKMYVGVDISETMLKEFRKTYPDVSLSMGSAHEYEDDKQYDLVFSNGVLQYFTLPMLREQFEHALRMLSPKGTIVHASIPWKALKSLYSFGFLTPPYRDLGLRPRVAKIARIILRRRDNMGRWYAPEELYNLAVEFNLSVDFFGSMHYPYRFHAVFHVEA